MIDTPDLPSDVEPQPEEIETLDGDRAKPRYGTTISQPDEKVGVEVGGGDKAAAAQSERARKDGQADTVPDDANPDDPEEAQSPT